MCEMKALINVVHRCTNGENSTANDAYDRVANETLDLKIACVLDNGN